MKFISLEFNHINRPRKEIILFKKVSFWISLIPWSFLLTFYGLVIRFRLKYKAWPDENPIDPKEISMDGHIGIIYLLLLYSLLSSIFFVFLVFRLFRNKPEKEDLLVIVIFFMGLVFFVHWLFYCRLTDWFIE